MRNKCESMEVQKTCLYLAPAPNTIRTDRMMMEKKTNKMMMITMTRRYGPGQCGRGETERPLQCRP